jgi:hypothetical protein
VGRYPTISTTPRTKTLTPKEGVTDETPTVKPASPRREGGHREFNTLNSDAVTGKAFDDRVGLVVMLWSLRQLRESEATVYAVATVQEEVGLRGAQVAA